MLKINTPRVLIQGCCAAPVGATLRKWVCYTSWQPEPCMGFVMYGWNCIKLNIFTKWSLYMVKVKNTVCIHKRCVYKVITIVCACVFLDCVTTVLWYLAYCPMLMEVWWDWAEVVACLSQFSSFDTEFVFKTPVYMIYSICTRNTSLYSTHKCIIAI